MMCMYLFVYSGFQYISCCVFCFVCLRRAIGQSLKVTRTGDRLWIEADEALNRFKAWLKVVTGLPDYDHAMAFTGYVKYVG
jgi:hypothetical protein